MDDRQRLLDLRVRGDYQATSADSVSIQLGDGDDRLALLVHSLTGEEHDEFRTPGARDRAGNVFDRRAYVQMSLQFG